MYNKHQIPALLSFLFPGLGQFIKGHRSKAYSIWITVIVLLVIVDLSAQPILLLFYLPVIVWATNDAYNSDDKDKF